MATKPTSPSLQVGNSLSTGLLVGLMLGEGTGTTTADLSGNGATATLAGGATWTTGASGAAVSCTGGGYLSVPMPAITSGEDFSLLIIHKPTTWPGGFTAILDESRRNWSLFFDTSGNISFATFLMQVSGTVGMTAGTLWQFLATRDRTASTTTYYRNGTSVNSGASGSGTAVADNVHFGDNPSGGGSNYDGVYDLICLWNRVITGTEVAALASDPYQMFRPPGAAFLAPRPLVAQRAVMRASTY